MSASPGILEVSSLRAGYGRYDVVRDLDLRIAEGEAVALLGPNGAGKSTLIKAVAGLVPITSGSVRLDDRDITRLPVHTLIGRGLGFVPQTENVFAAMSIDDNLLLAAAILPRERRAGRVAAMYAMFPDLAAKKSLAAGRLSGGQRQMLAIARALLVEPEVLMLDEPSAGLSPKIVGTVFETLQRVRQSGVAILLVEQSVRAALAIADRAYVLAEGRNRHEGPALQLRDDPMIAHLYFGGDPVSPASAAP
jgi:branched-chain amino acid transport system ATP-binding protein